MNQYLIAANSKKGQLIFSIFRPVDAIIASVGVAVTLVLFLIFKPENLVVGILVLLPLLTCTLLVLPIPNYHNVLCVLQNIYKFYLVDKNQIKWNGWCYKNEYKDK